MTAPESSFTLPFAPEDRARMTSEDFEDEQTLSLSLSLASPLLLDATVDGFLKVMMTLGLLAGGDCCCERVEGRGVDREDVAFGGRGIRVKRARARGFEE